MLFEDNYNFYDYKNKLEDLSTGFIKGNIFKNEYIKYKNYKPQKINPKSQKEKELLEIMELSFAINDLNLYLDLEPNNKEIFKIFKELLDKLNYLEEQYKNKYNSLTLNNTTKSYNWINDLPWMNTGDSTYV